MAYQLFRLPKAVGLDSAVRALSGAKAYFFETGTTTPQDTYSDAELTTPHAHPVVADSSGVFPPIYLDPSRQYKLTLNNSADVLIYTVDPVNDRHGVSYDRTAAEIASGITPTDYSYPPGHAKRYGAAFDNTTDDTVAIQTALDSGHDVYLPEGTAVISDTLFARVTGITIYGAGKHRTILRQTASDKHGIRVSDVDGSVTNSHKITIRDLQITGLHQTSTAEFRGIYVPGSDDVTVQNVKVYDCYCDSGISVGFISDGNDPTLTRSQRCRVIDCDVDSIDGPGTDGIGIELIGAIDVLVRGCFVTGTKIFGIRCNACTRATITNNHVSDFDQIGGAPGIVVTVGTIPGPALTSCTDVIVANNHVRIDSDRVSGTYIGVQVLGAQRVIVQGNRITMSDTANASTDFRGIDIQSALTGVDNEQVIVSNNIINGSGLDVGVSIGNDTYDLKLIGNIVDGFTTYGIRSIATDLTGEAFGNTLMVGDAAAVAISKSISAAGEFFCWGNTTDATDNRPFESTDSSFIGKFGGFTRRVTRSSSNLDMSGVSPQPIETGDRVRFTTTGTLPSPLVVGTDYYAIRVDDDSIQVATTIANAVAGTNITLTDAGTGNHSITVMRGIWANAVR